jgi:phosphotransferase system HPr (HPr) family protein
MNGRLREAVVIVNPQGLHLRPATAFAKLAQRFECAVTVWKGENSVNGKSPLDLLLLAAEPGTELVVEVHGHDAKTALPALLEVLATPFTEDLEAQDPSAA